MPKNCKLKHTCTNLYQLLNRLGHPGEEPRCDGLQPCQGVFDNITEVTRLLNTDNANDIAEFIRTSFGGSLPIEHTAVALNQVLQRAPFFCGEIATEIQQPCHVTTCAYWSDNAWTRNCILYYLLDQHRSMLDIKELTFLLGESSSELRRRINATTVEMRHWALKHKTEQADNRLPVRIVEEERCSACGVALPEDVIYQQGYCYCSLDCIDKKTPLDLRIEQDFRLPIDRVLQICVDSFGAKRPICHALSVTGRELDELCDRHHVSADHLP